MRPTEDRRNGFVMWECKCDCGNTVLAKSGSLRNGSKLSCGCLQRERTVEHTAKDLTGQRFGRLVAIRPTEERKYEKVVWECQCDCGNTAFITSSCLIRGKTTSCGCLQKEYIAKELIKDLTGQRFGKLIAIRPEKERKNGQVVWECKCDCGNTVSVRGANLRNGHTTSCGSCPKEGLPGNNIKDLTGKRFGRLIAVRPTEERKNGYVMWECICDCGNTTFARSASLNNGNKTSCGCLRESKENGNAGAKDLTGQRFGRLLVLGLAQEQKPGRKTWECKCDCGNTISARNDSLISGKTLSCGCLKKERVAKANGKDLMGQRFGKLVVIKPTEERKNGKRVWECLCDCGKTVFVRSTSLINGNSTSCGCTRAMRSK